MFCENCGKKIEKNSQFCIYCGHRFLKESHTTHFWNKKKVSLLLILTILITSAIWFVIYASLSVSTEDEAVNIIENSLETIGRQYIAWENTETIIDLLAEGFSSDCLLYDSCINDLEIQITTLRANVEKEKEEIDKVWSTGLVSEDLENFYNNLDYQNQLRIDKVMDAYFPEESERLDTNANFL